MLMRHIWQEIDESTRLALGRLLPGFLDAFILERESGRAFDLGILGLLGFDRIRSLEIARESYVAAYGGQQPRKSALFAIKRLFNLVRVARIDAHGPTREALVRSGWIDDQTPVARDSGG
jgi:hypothetical protein